MLFKAIWEDDGVFFDFFGVVTAQKIENVQDLF